MRLPSADEAARRSPLAAERRWNEISLLVFAFLIVAGAYCLVALADKPDRPALPPDIAVVGGTILGLIVLMHVAVRRLAPRADSTLLPLAALLNGLGYVVIVRLDRNKTDLGHQQGRWVAIAAVAFVATLWLVRRARDLERYRYTLALVGVAALLLPLLPGLGATINGARVWIRLGPLTFQPAEIAKVLLVLFFAAYLADKRELLAVATRRIGPVMLPDVKHFGPLLLAWGAAMLVMVRQRDLGTSLLFFTVFVFLLYITTGRGAYGVLGAILFGLGAFAAYHAFGHVHDRIDVWLHPFADPQGKGFQLVQARFAFGSGGLTGTGLGLGTPTIIPFVQTDFIFAAIGEELGLLGATAVLIAFLLLVASAYRIALRLEHPFTKLFAAGLATLLGVQTIVIVGGVTGFLPLTGITLPFVSYGGSSLLVNYVILALLLRMSDEAEEQTERDRDGDLELLA
jgi:cell division protein FtsW (lipid II flippase)